MKGLANRIFDIKDYNSAIDVDEDNNSSSLTKSIKNLVDFGTKTVRF